MTVYIFKVSFASL